MKYYNQNPQVTALLEKIEEQEECIRHWQGKCAELQQEVDIAHEMCGKCLRFAENFNKKPWYDKMFLKFELS